MKAVISVYFEGNPIDENSRIQITIGCDENEYGIDIYCKPDESFASVISEEDIKQAIKNFNLYSILNSKEEIELKKYLSTDIVLRDLHSSQEIELCGRLDEIAKYLDKNPELAHKKIIIGRIFTLNRGDLAKIKNNFDVDRYDILVKIQGNSRAISLDEYEMTIDIITQIVEKIKRYNYSPLEMLIHVYDLIRNRVYVREDENQEYYESRDLTSVLLGDKIVCLGYVKLFNAILNKLGIKCLDFILDVKGADDSHARSLVFLKDEKYNINGLYFFDPTFDSKKADDSNSFLNCYLYFAKTYNQLVSFESGELIYSTYQYFDNEKIMDLEDKIMKKKLQRYQLAAGLINNHINWMLRFVGKDFMAFSTVNIDMENVLESMYEIADLANQPIDVATFLKALYVVRKNEYYEEPAKYAFDMEAITNILINSKVLDIHNNVSQLFNAIFGVCFTINEEEAHKIVSNFFKANDLDVDMARVKLARTLKTVYEKKALEQKK